MLQFSRLASFYTRFPNTCPEQKAPRLQQVWTQITEKRGELSIDFLAKIGQPSKCTTTMQHLCPHGQAQPQS
ncbi:MAG: hypothetical protein ACFB0D_22925 [Phormidesmis sp.]